MADYSSFFDNLGSGLNLAGTVLGAGNASTNNSNVQSTLGANSQNLADQIAALQAQTGQGRQITQDLYNQANTLYGQQNQQLQGNIDTMTQNLTGLNDPNSPYMQMLRQKLERADAAAGRRSQVGEREVQLAAALADYVGKYSPSINNSITQARNQMTTNNTGLADLYARMTGANTAASGQANNAMQLQQALAGAQNTTGRGAANNNTNSTLAMLQAAAGLGKSIWGSGGGGGLGEGNNGQSWGSGMGGLDNSQAMALWSSPQTSWGYGGDVDNYSGDPYGGDYSSYSSGLGNNDLW